MVSAEKPLDDRTIYRFVRMDLREEDQAVQLGHAVFMMCTVFCPGTGFPRIVDLDGGASEKAFRRTIQKLTDRGIQFVVYTDPDHPEWGATAIATAPLTEAQSLPLKQYRLRRYSAVAQGKSDDKHRKVASEDAGSSPAGGASLEEEGLRSSDSRASGF